MRELARVLPSGTWLNDISASASGDDDSSAGGAPSPAAPASSPSSSSSSSSSSASGADPSQGGSTDPSLHLMGCAVRQHNVALVLVRLRQLHRATDVDLAESAEETNEGSGTTSTQGGTGSDDSCGTGRFKFDVTVTFAPASPAADAIETKAPASLGGGS